MNQLVAADNRQAPAPAGADGQYLTFMLGGEVFAIAILAVREIIEYGELANVPLMPRCIRGVINLRGVVVPVMDLSARFGRPSLAPGKRTCIVIVEMADAGAPRVIGLMVDAVNAVLDIAAAEIEQAPQFGVRIRTDLIAGMGKVGGKFVIVLDIERVLALDAPDLPAEPGAAGPGQA